MKYKDLSDFIVKEEPKAEKVEPIVEPVAEKVEEAK
jgi:hypothetical protein